MSARHLTASAVLSTAAVLATAGTTALLSPTASAATPPTVATVAGGTLSVVAGPGFDNRITVSQTVPATAVLVRDALRPITTAFPCSNLSPNEISCPANFAQRLDISLGNGNDVVHNGTPRPAVLRGGTGEDVLSGTRGADAFSGGPGRDTVTYQARTAGVTVRLDGFALDGEPGELDDVRTDVEDVRGGRGNDTIVGSPAANRLFGDAGQDRLAALGGDDLLDGGSGPDRLSGGPGRDTVTYAARTVRVFVDLDDVANDGQLGESDNALSDVEDVIGGQAADELTGSAAANRLEGRSGSDRLTGRDGPDRLEGGPDADVGHGGAGVDVCDTEFRTGCP